MKIQILSYGGGVQTIAMCVLVAQGTLPRPDYVIAADTGREMPTTWEYADRYARPLLAKVGLELRIAGHELATRDLYSPHGDILIPAYTDTGKLSTFCSNEWKQRVVQRYARSLGVGADNEVWIGYSLDESWRIKDRTGRRFPLVDLMLTKADCQSLIEAAGLPLPRKSRCWMCPHQSNREWQEVRNNPQLWEAAIELDIEIRDSDERGGLYLHRERVPLYDADLSNLDERENRQCGFGMCFI